MGRRARSSRRSGSHSSRRRRVSSRSCSGSLAKDVLKGLGLAALFTAKLVAKGIKAVASRGRGRSSDYERIREAIEEEGRRRGLEGEPPECVVKRAYELYLEGIDFD